MIRLRPAHPRLSRGSMKKLITFLILSLFFVACGQWKVTRYKGKKHAFIESGESQSQVMIKADDFGLEVLSMGVNICDGNICYYDNILKRIQIMKPNGEMIMVVGSTKNINTKKTQAVNFNFNIIGYLLVDDEGNIYVQNSLPNARQGVEIYSPSYITVFNKEGNLQYTLGQTGPPDTPFTHIENIDVDEKGRLFVVASSSESWSVFRFAGKKRDFYINLGKLSFEEKEGETVYPGRIENVRVFSNGEDVLISVVYYHELRLKYKKIFQFSIKAGKIIKELMTIPDPKNVFFNIIDDKYLYFWNLDENNVIIMKCTMSGSIIDNILLEIDNKNCYYSKILCDKSGKFYSYHVTKRGIEIFKWE